MTTLRHIKIDESFKLKASHDYVPSNTIWTVENIGQVIARCYEQGHPERIMHIETCLQVEVIQ